MPWVTYIADDGTEIHKLERAKSGTAAVGKPIVSNTKMSLQDAEAMFDKEVKTNMKDPAKVSAFVSALNTAITESRQTQMNKNKGIAEIQATITAPKGTKAKLIEMIEEMVTDPVDRLKLKMKSKSKGELETLYIKMKAIHDWHIKNRPGKGIDYV